MPHKSSFRAELSKTYSDIVTTPFKAYSKSAGMKIKTNKVASMVVVYCFCYISDCIHVEIWQILRHTRTHGMKTAKVGKNFYITIAKLIERPSYSPSFQG
jgi:hypothetical protein